MSPAETLLNKRILLLNNWLYFNFEVPGEASAQVNAISDALRAFDSISNQPIKLIISSLGGSLLGAFALYDAIKSVDSPVWTFGHLCGSGAALILAAGDKGHRYVYPNCFTMLHQPQIITSTTAGEDVSLREIRTKEFVRKKNTLVGLLIESGVKKTPKQVRKDIDREFWLDAKETVEYGLADKVIRGGLLLE